MQSVYRSEIAMRDLFFAIRLQVFVTFNIVPRRQQKEQQQQQLTEAAYSGQRVAIMIIRMGFQQDGVYSYVASFLYIYRYHIIFVLLLLSRLK